MKKIAYNPDKLLSEDFRLGELIACEAAERLNHELMRGRLAGETQGWIPKDAMRQHFGSIK